MKHTHDEYIACSNKVSTVLPLQKQCNYALIILLSLHSVSDNVFIKRLKKIKKITVTFFKYRKVVYLWTCMNEQEQHFGLLHNT